MSMFILNLNSLEGH